LQVPFAAQFAHPVGQPVQFPEAAILYGALQVVQAPKELLLQVLQLGSAHKKQVEP
jgi:hypothetical protein